MRYSPGVVAALYLLFVASVVVASYLSGTDIAHFVPWLVVLAIFLALAVGVSKTFAWQIEPRTFGSAPNRYHSSQPQQSRQQQAGGNPTIAFRRGL